MTVLASFEPLPRPFAAAMAAPGFQDPTPLVVGWLFAPRRTVTGMLVAADLAGKRRHAAFHRLFAGARRNPDAVGLAVFGLIAPPCGETALPAVDDTLCRQRGRRMFGAGMRPDPPASSRGTAVTGYGRSRVVPGAPVAFPLGADRVSCLPALSRLSLNKASAAERRRAYRAKPEPAVELPASLCRRRSAGTRRAGGSTRSRTAPAAAKACGPPCRRTAA